MSSRLRWILPLAALTSFFAFSAEKKELTVIHIGGSINLASLQEVVNSTIHYDLKSAGGQ